MLQAIARAITCVICSEPRKFTERFIRLVLEEVPLVGNPAKPVNGDRLPNHRTYKRLSGKRRVLRHKS